jgi:enoyl-CoA hydratase
MTEPVILVKKKNQTVVITLNRPDAMNALSTELIKSLHDTFCRLKDDTSAGVVILTGAGRSFCAGLDLKELESGQNMLGEMMEKNLILPLKDFGRPIIGAVNGPAITGGFELALACDILIASTKASFADTHARVGILPGSELSQKLSRTIGIYRAKELSLTGNFINAARAEAWGLVNRVVEPEKLLPTCLALADDILSCPRDMVRSYKKLIDDGFHMSYGDAVAIERKRNQEHFKSVKPQSIADRKKGIFDRGRSQKK